MESNVIVFISLFVFAMLAFLFLVYLDYLQGKHIHDSKIKILEGQKFELENRLKNQSDVIRTLMDWKKEDEKTLIRKKTNTRI